MIPYLTTEEFISQITDLGFVVMKGVRDSSNLIILDDKNTNQYPIALVKSSYQYKVIIYWDNFSDLIYYNDEYGYDKINTVQDKLYTILFRYARTPVDNR